MKRVILFTGMFLYSFFLTAQPGRYTELIIPGAKTMMDQLGRLGLPLEEGFYSGDGSWTIVLQDRDLNKLKSAGITFRILREDYTSYVEKRNSHFKKTSETYPYQVPGHFELGSMGGFYTLDEVLNELDSMRSLYPGLISVRTQVGTTSTVFGRPLYFVRISNNPDVNQDKPRILYNALHHAREPMGMQQLIFFMWYLLENYAASEEIRYLVDNLEIYFIPVVNPDGYHYNDSIAPAGGGMWRKNRRNNGGGDYGVDLNRNYGYMWGYDDVGSSPYPYDETYRGPGAFSEPETQAIRDFCNEKDFLIAMNYHTYQNLLMYPWCYATQMTPDSTLDQEYAGFFTRRNNYNSGTMGEVLYNTNGDASDWQYGEQTSKPKIYSFTSEIGGTSDGFWPFPDRIIPLAEENMYCNLMMAHLALRYAEVKRASPVIIPDREGYFSFSFRRYGINSPADYTLSIQPLDSSQIISTGPPVIISNPDQFGTYHDSVHYVLSPDLPTGSEIKYILNLNNGLYTFRDTVTHYFGPPLDIFSDRCDDMSEWISPKWNVTHSLYHSPDGSITDSPQGNYLPNSNVPVTTINRFSLNDTPVAVLEFWARWNIEKKYDYVQVQISDDDGATWEPLSGLYTHPGSEYQAAGEPVYDGKVYQWMKEEILLNDYLAEEVKLRYILKSNDYLNFDGFYFDDVRITKIDMTTGIARDEEPQGAVLSIPIPNPASRTVVLKYILPAGTEEGDIVIIDSRGAEAGKIALNQNSGKITIDVNRWSPGIYFCKLACPVCNPVIRKLTVIR